MCFERSFSAEAHSVHLPVFDKLRTEIIVYPSPKEVAGLQELQ